MRKITSLLMLLLFCVSTAWAITYPESEKVYTIKNFHGFVNGDTGYDHYMASNNDGTVLVGADSPSSELCYWQFEKVDDREDHTFYLKNYSNKKYAYIATPNANSQNVELSDKAETIFYLFDGHQNKGEVFIATQNRRVDDNQTWGIHGNSAMDTWQGAGAGNSWILEEVKFVTVTYNFTYDNAVKYTQTFEKLKDGAEYPDYSTSEFAYGVVAAAKPVGTINGEEAVEGVVTKEIALSIDLPFELSTSFDAAKWYAMTIRDDGPTFLQYQAGTDYIKANVDELKIDNNQSNAYMWAFLGNPFDGIKIINKAAGAGKVLSSPTAPTGEKNEGELARMVDESTATGNTTWIIKATTHNAITSDAFYIVHPTNTDYALNRQSYNNVNALCYWTGRDTGSSVQVFDLSDNVQYENNDAALTNFWTKADTYPSTINTYLPVYKYQRIFTAKENNLDLLVVFEGGSDRINTKGVDVVDASGNVVASKYHNGFCGSNVENNYYFVRNLVPGTTYLLRCFVTHDVGGDGLNQTKGKIYIGDASTASEDEVNTFATTLQTNVGAKKTWGGTTYGYYTQASVDAMKDAYDAVDATKNATTISTLIDKSNSLQCILPQPGTFLRIKNNNETGYLSGDYATSGRVHFVADIAESANSVFYFTGSQLVSYTTGLYLAKGPKEDFVHYTQTVGEEAGTTFAFSASPTLGKLLVSFHNGNRSFYSSGVGESNAAGSGQTGDSYRYTVEEVEWLPVPMNTAAGYATLYSPVALNNKNRVEAYVGKVEGEWFKMTRVDEDGVIPANTPVVLKYVENAEVDNNCVYLQIVDSEKTAVVGEENQLAGTFADAYIKDDAYVLGYVGEEDSKEVGFYTATKNQQEGASWLNNGFKAYLPIVNESGEAPVQVLRFNFGGETTAIESVLNNGVDANAPIYDLSGRRVMNAVKGGIYIQNGKKFIVK